MRKNNIFHSGKMKTVIAALIMLIFVSFTFIVIFYVMLRRQLEDFWAQNIDYGLSYYYDIQNYTEAEKKFKTALFLEKYIIFWDNKNLPICYTNLALVNGGLEKYEKSADLYEQALSAYEKYLPQDYENIALVHTNVSLIYSLLGNNSMVLEHASMANDYYQSLEREQQNINAGTAALELAYACYNTGDYETAAIHFETGIPIIYDFVDWSIDITAGPRTLAIAYKVAADTYGRLGNQEIQQHYENKYEDIVWIRQIGEDEIAEFMKSFHWGM